MTDDPHQNASGTGIAQAYGEGARATVNITGFRSEDGGIWVRFTGQGRDFSL
jgi:hypothetical protein